LTGLVALFAAAVCFVAGAPSAADGPKDNLPDKVRPIPPTDKAVNVPPEDLAELKAGLDELRKAIDDIPAAFGTEHPLVALLPDVEVYHKAVRFAVELGEFYNPKEIVVAKAHLKTGLKRAAELRANKPSWTTQTGLVVRGYRSKIDGSVQPYGIVVPKEFAEDRTTKRRLDVWWHGRGETLTEVNFIQQRQTNPGEFTPAGAFVLHPYGRYCNANKFAGETDTFECLMHARTQYPIDWDRLVARGFSMGGAACWQFAVHYPTFWVAAAPGAGFAETKEFLNNFQNEKVKPEWWEERLWRMYDATAYAQNLFNLPTVAYSGENDRQKQAADVMAREMEKVGLELTHVIGPKTGHKYEPGAKEEINKRIDALAAKKLEHKRKEIKFVTYTLNYSVCDWVHVRGMEKHWSPATVHATLDGERGVIKTTGVTRLIVYPPMKGLGVDRQPGFPNGKLVVTIDGDEVGFDRGAALMPAEKVDGKWRVGMGPRDKVVKVPSRQGPIDDAFTNRFLMVRPTGKPLNAKVGEWADAEMKRAIDQWKKQFRGDTPVKDDKDVTLDDINRSNLILWGDPSSNSLMAKVFDTPPLGVSNKLPIRWTADGVVVGDQTYPAGTHVPALIYFNPLVNGNYIVINSGFTFREYDYLNNARQVPKLPDYAVIDVTTPPNSRWPGRVVRAGFFGEEWELLPNDGR
jgi:hypothetical protein